MINIKKFNKEHIILFTGLMITFLLFIFMIIMFSVTNDTEKTVTYQPVTLNGEYKNSDSGWKKFDENTSINTNGNGSLTVKGTLQQPIKKGGFLIVKMQNVWTQVKVDGKIVASNFSYKDKVKTDTPGYSIAYIDSNLISDSSVVELTMSNPYRLYGTDFYLAVLSSMITGDKDALYNELYYNHFIEILISLVIIFLGLFAFSFAGALFTDVKYNYLSFSLVAIFGGLYILTDVLSPYLPLWINNPMLCSFLNESTNYLLGIAGSLYMRSNLIRKTGKKSMSIIIGLFIAITILALILQFVGIQDILASEIFMTIPFIASFIIGIVFLIIGGFKYGNLNAKLVSISFIPILFAYLLDEITSIFNLVQQPIILHCAIFIAIVIQIVQIIIATMQSYKRSLQFEKMQTELLESRVVIMISQIQPHFLYNALTSIAQLCEKDPKRAKKATIEFADYLRGNMNSIKDRHPVPFETELKHLKTYLSLEKMRFGDELNIEYDIECVNFSIPSLTVQPLVENAVKHGVGMKEDGGTITISTRENENSYEIIVADDGVGFDTTKPNPDTSRTHVGIENIKDRLSSMCNAVVTIESKVGIGTTSKITIPKEK